MKANYEMIRKAVGVLHPDNKLFEVRIISGKWITSGYFTSAETLISEIEHYNLRQGANVYITLNRIAESCYSRKQRDKLIEVDSSKPTTSDNDIINYDWLFIDLDPKRASGTSSSESELEQAKNKGNEIYSFLKAKGFSDPVCAISGNGVHLLYKINLEKNDENVKLVWNVITTLNNLFADGIIDIDVKIANPARICKLYGTLAQKGTNTTERPHRQSYIKTIPQKIETNSKQLLQSIADIFPKDEPKFTPNNGNNKFDLDNFIGRYSIPVRERKSHNGGTMYVLEHCLFDESHKGKDAAIFQTSDGKICYNCFHNSCSKKHWKDVRLMYEPNAYLGFVSDYIKPNYTTQIQSPTNPPKEPPFLTTEQIRLQKRPNEQFLKCGISGIDNKMRGLKKGFVTCLSGLRGCGKSSIISQIAINLAENGFRTALFSGELTGKNVLKWLTLQAAGSKYVFPTQYENYYTYTPETAEKISKWLDGKIYVYNNDYENDYTKIEQYLETCITKNKIDLIILDNLMSMNLMNLDSDKYARQSRFVEQLEKLAKNYNVHIIFVAHPRKSYGFLRLEDVSGSNDIINRVDNAFIMHRVNKDFKIKTQEFFGWDKNNPYYKATNIIEICKDRDGGLQDELIPLWFDKPSKRLKNKEFENITYSWEKTTQQSETNPPFGV